MHKELFTLFIIAIKTMFICVYKVKYVSYRIIKNNIVAEFISPIITAF